MQTTLFLIRHAQSHPSVKLENHQWPLSERGRGQAQKLVPILQELGLARIYTSPFERCLKTIAPFLEVCPLPVEVHHDLREKKFTHTITPAFKEIWVKAWDDFDFKIPDTECSRGAQTRFVSALKEIAEKHPGETLGISTHGMVIALLLNFIDNNYLRPEAEKVKNPDVIKITYINGSFTWHREFICDEPHHFSSYHDETPYDTDPE